MTATLTLSDLNANLVPFQAHEIHTSIIWCARDIENPEVLRKECSYRIGHSNSASVKTFYAERYGGSGIQRNGGGARCGFDGCYQVKGIGANLLVGEGTERGHSSGVLGACEAMYEALWSEVLDQILPYGAIRTRAVLLVEEREGATSAHCQEAPSRALLVREPAIRPAHFERAPYFRMRPDITGQLSHDAQRLKAVMPLLPASLPAPPTGFSEDALHDLQHYCIEGLCEVARRQALQMGFCRTRFLRLTTSPSNTAMDGRLLDFNGLSCLFPGDHHYDFEYKLRLTEMMKEPVLLQQGLSNICLYLGKYLFSPAFTSLAIPQVEKTFQQSFQWACCCGYLELLGIPAERLQLTTIPEVVKRLIHSFIRLLGSQSNRIYCPSGNTTGISPLENLVVTLIHCSQRQQLRADENRQQDERFREVSGYLSETLHWFNQQPHIDSSRFLEGMESRARRRLRPRQCLGKSWMFTKIDRLLDEHKHSPLTLKDAFSEMGTQMQTFASEVLGHHQNTRNKQ